MQIKSELIPVIEKELQGRIQIEYYDISDVENYKYLLKLKAKYSPQIKITLPVFFLEGKLINGEGNIAKKLRGLIAASSGSPYKEGKLPGIEMNEFFMRFNLLGITLAGLEDGINPCAFTVIVFFISYLAFQGYKRRELIIIGLTFIATVFCVYLLIGLGLFNFLYAFKGFWIITRVLNTAIGALSILLGMFALYDFYKFRKTKETDGLLLQLPSAVKNRIHYVIGLHYRKDKDKASSSGLSRLILSAVITGFLVTLLEAVCTGQLYLPTILFILKTSKMKLEAAGYLIFYNLLFIAPLFAVFILSLLGITSSQFSAFLKKHMGAIKLIMAGVFLALGIALVWAQAPQLIHEQAPPAKNIAQESLSDSWDFGRVKEGEVLKHSFLLKNTSKKVLRIDSLDTSCGCTGSRIEKKLLSPSESTVIEVSFNTKGYSGPVKQYVYAHTDSLDNPVLRFIIKADVVK